MKQITILVKYFTFFIFLTSSHILIKTAPLGTLNEYDNPFTIGGLSIINPLENQSQNPISRIINSMRKQAMVKTMKKIRSKKHNQNGYVISTKIVTTVSPKKSKKSKQVQPVFSSEESPLQILNDIIGGNHSKHEPVFSEYYENEHEFSPFAQVLKELIKEAKEFAEREYHEGSELSPESYHEKVLSPTVIIFRNKDGQKYNTNESGDQESVPEIIEKILENLVKGNEEKKNLKQIIENMERKIV